MAQTQLLIDADAWLCLRSLGWIERLLAHPDLRVLMAERTFKMELNDLRRELDAAQAAGALEVVQVLKKTPAHERYRLWTRDSRLDRGEAEAVAWASTRTPEASASLMLVFTTNDKGAQKLAHDHGVVAWAVFRLLVEGSQRGWWTEVEAKAVLRRWDDNPHDRSGRPADFTTVDDTWARACKALLGGS